MVYRKPSWVSFWYKLDDSDERDFQNVGTLYNFVVDAEVIGIYDIDDKSYLISWVMKSYGENCMVGTIDVREITFQNFDERLRKIYSNNNISETAMGLAKLLNCENIKNAILNGAKIEDIQKLRELGFIVVPNPKTEVQNIIKGNYIHVVGINAEHFEKINRQTQIKQRKRRK